MAIVPNKHDPHYDEECKRMKKIANGSSGKERMQQEFGIDVTKGELPKEGTGAKASSGSSAKGSSSKASK